MEFKKILVTPTLAKQYLEANVKNRNVNQGQVIFYANQMESGKWKEDTGECIKISKEGVILDGQHRLLAIIRSNKSMFFHFALDVEQDVFSVLDTGKQRSAGDVFKIEGISYATAIPAVISCYHLYKNNIYIKDSGKHKKLSNSQILDTYNNDRLYWNELVKKAEIFKKDFQKILTSAMLGGIYAILNDIDKNKSLDFMQQLTTGRNITNDTILVLRNKLIEDKLSVSKIPLAIKTIYIIKTWNCFLSNKEIKVLKFNKQKEEQPTFNKK